jgi:hypothetical protein
LRSIERVVGRERFDAFARRYLDTFRFRALTTEEFLAFTERELPGVLATVGADRWVHGEGLPETAPEASSERLKVVVAMGDAVPPAGTALSSTEWNLWLDRSPRPRPPSECATLDERFGFTKTGNMEVKVAWLRVAIPSKFDDVLPEVERVLCTVGRMKYLNPLYAALLARDDLPRGPGGAHWARAVFERARDSYHPIARAVVLGRLTKAGQ